MSLTYGPDGGPTGFVSGNSATFAGITNAFSYNKRLQPVAMSANAPSQTVYSIGYDFHAGNGTVESGADNGNVWGITNYKDTTHGRDQGFTYDSLNRVTSAQNTGTNCAAMTVNNKTEYWGNSYGYDAWGNLLQKTITKCGAENFLVTADAHNWIHASGTDYQYDAAGNMTFDATANLSYSFDQENRLTGSAGYTYTYDGDGNRVRKSNGNLAANGTLYWAMTPGVVAETDLAGTTKSEYIFFDGERVARRDGATGTGGVFYYFSDHLKTASVITDSAGTIKAESDYYPWGGELQFTNSDTNHYKFTGKERDGETQLDYFGARYYSNALGRWVSADWSATPAPVPYANFADPQTLNLYNFVGGNPASEADPNGHATEMPDPHQNLLDLSQFQFPLNDIALHRMPICFCQGAQNTTTAAAAVAPAAAPAAAPTTAEEINAVVKPLVQSAEGALDSAGSKLLGLAGDTLGVVGMVLLNPQKLGGGPGDVPSPNDKMCCTPDDQYVPTPEAAHKTGARESTRGKHQEGQARKRRDRGGEKGDARRRPPRKPPDNWKGPWPPKDGQNWN